MIRGLVLCGGESKRMGRDKGMLVTGGATWAEHAVTKLRELDIPVVISVNEKQLASYRCIFDQGLLVLDQVDAKGPLSGLLSVHLQYPMDDLLVLACDMPEMDVHTLRVLKDDATTFPEFDTYCYVNKGIIEPLCALYTSTFLKYVYSTMKKGILPGFSLQRIIKQGRHKEIPVVDHVVFNNHNSPLNILFQQ